MARNILSDDDWHRLKQLIPPKKTKKGRPRKDDRNVVEAILWILRTGAPWRDLPSEFGPWKTVYTRFRRWSLDGTWNAIWAVQKKRIRRRITYD